MKNALKLVRHFFLKDLWAIDTSPLGRVKAFSVQTLRLLAIITKDVIDGPLTLWAMSLVYTTLLSLVPLLAVSFSVLKAFGVHNKIEPFLFNFLAPLGPKGTELSQRIVEFVNNMKVGVLGFVGLALLIYTVVSLIQKIERSFNSVWRVRTLRSVLRRFSDYLSVILVGPVLVFAAIGITATALSTSFMQRLIAVEPIGTILYYTGELVPYVLVCAAFTFIYVFIPNTKVKLSSALVGGIFGGVLWETIGWGFGSFVVTTTKYGAIYSGFAVLIFFMIWLYVSWLILLVGAEISFYHQNPHALSIRRAARIPDAHLLEQIAVSIMFLIAYNFYYGKGPWTLTALTHRLGLALESAEAVVEALKKKLLIVETGDDPPAYLPTRDLEAIRLREVYVAVRLSATGDDGFERKNIVSLKGVVGILRAIDDAVGRALGETTLKDLVAGADKEAGGKDKG
ncbi:MAG: YhjD/YihY/BrkB family envelope integrity protein [Betaproteobacteria bacterium]